MQSQILQYPFVQQYVHQSHRLEDSHKYFSVVLIFSRKIAG